MSLCDKRFPFDPEMFTLFRQEIKTHLGSFQEAFQRLQSGKNFQEAIASLIRATHLIKSSAALIQLVSLVDLSKALDSLWNRMQKKSFKDSANYSPIVDQFMSHLKVLVQADDSLLVSKVLERDQDLDKNIQEIYQILEGFQEQKEKKDLLKEGERNWTADLTLANLFKIELENQANILSKGLISIEQNEDSQENLGSMLRAAHSIKGAARVVELGEITQLAHVIEDVLIGVKNGLISLDGTMIDSLLKTVDFLSTLSRLSASTIPAWLIQKKSELEDLQELLLSFFTGSSAQTPSLKTESLELPKTSVNVLVDSSIKKNEIQDKVLRVTAQNLNKLMGLAAESMVESRWLLPFSQSLIRLKKNISELVHYVDILKANLKSRQISEEFDKSLKQLTKKGEECQQILNLKISDLDHFINRNSSLSDRLYREVVDSRMRCFSDGIEGFPRMVRDLAKQLNKKVRLEVHGKGTLVDRDILEKLEAPLAHLLRNAVDHGIELPEERLAAGKSAEGTIRVDAQHRAGMLSISISDDGRGIDIETIRKKVIERGLVNQEIGAKLKENELIDFLFLQGFTTASKVTEISGRGIGLNIVQNVIQKVSGNVNVSFVHGKGTVFNLQLPLSLSVIRALLIEIEKEPYAIALSRIDRAVFIPQESVELVENKQYFCFEGKNIGLIAASQVLGFEEIKHSFIQIPVVIVNDRLNSYGIVVDRFLGEKELVVQELDHRIGKVPDISGGAFMEDGSPILILDLEDIVRSIDTILTEDRLSNFSYSKTQEASKKLKKVLVVDDSITVREVECRLLRNHGYEVETAINGMEAWNALRMWDYDLVITDVDMPRMNGIELVRAIKSDARLRSLPVMIVSYKEHEEDRLKGLEAGANYYLTKSGFHDEALIHAVVDLIGEA